MHTKLDEKRLDELLLELRGEPHEENEGQKEVAELIRLARIGLLAEALDNSIRNSYEK